MKIGMGILLFAAAISHDVSSSEVIRSIPAASFLMPGFDTDWP